MIDIKTLRAAGLTADQIVKVLEEDQAKEREQARIRQRNHRARNGDLRDKRDTTYKEPSFLSNREKERTGRKTVMPVDWKPAIAPEDAAEFQRFTNYCKANAKVYADWDAAWRNWQTSPYRNGGQTNGRGRRSGSVLDAGDRLREKLHAQGSFADQYVEGSSGPTPLRLDNEVRAPSLRLIPKG